MSGGFLAVELLCAELLLRRCGEILRSSTGGQVRAAQGLGNCFPRTWGHPLIDFDI